MKTHSRRTGKIILIALALILVSSGTFFYFAFDEANKIQLNEERFRALDCRQMDLEITNHYESWKVTAFIDKGC